MKQILFQFWWNCCVNDVVSVPLAEKLSKIFLEIIIAPDFEPEAFEILSKKKNIRLMKLDTTLEVEQQIEIYECK